MPVAEDRIDLIVSYRARRGPDTLPPMTREQRDFLRKLIDARMRKRLDGLAVRGGSPPGSVPRPPRRVKSVVGGA